MAVNRTTIVRGPCVIDMGSQKFLTKGDVILEVSKKAFPIDTAVWGKLEDRLEDSEVKVRFTPVGEWLSAMLTILYPYMNPSIGSSIFGAADVPVYIWGQDGQKVTLAAAAVTKMPSLNLSARKTIFGECELTCVPANATTRITANSIFTIAAGTFPSLSTFDRTKIRTSKFGVVWGASPFDSIITEDGITIDFNVSVEPVKIDDEGTIDMTLSGVEVTAKLVPIGKSLVNILDALNIQGTNGAIGGSFFTQANDLVITGAASGDPLVTIKKAALQDNFQATWGSGKKRLNDLVFKTQRGVTAGVPDALFSLALVT